MGRRKEDRLVGKWAGTVLEANTVSTEEDGRSGCIRVTQVEGDCPVILLTAKLILSQPLGYLC